MDSILASSVQGGAELRRVADALRMAGRADLQRAAAKALKAEAQPALRDVRQAARSVSVTGVRAGGTPFAHATKPKHLRERIAAASVVEYRANASEARLSFHVDSKRMGDAKVIPRYIDLGKPWRHPIMGMRTKPWAVSKGRPWFFKPIKKHLPDMRKRISAALDEIVTKIEEL